VIVARVLRETGLPARQWLELELTESLLMRDVEQHHRRC
jgi:EAL domain-containing protein (putative c-di-GMP-specific phosphodiesterase class I)